MLTDFNRFAEAEVAYRQAIQRSPNDLTTAHLNLGWLLLQLKRYSEAKEWAEELWEGWNGHPWISPFFGCVLLETGDNEEAERCFRWAIDDTPDKPSAYINLGIALANQKRYSDAEQAFRQAIKLDPSNTEVYNRLALILMELDKYSEAEEAFRRVVKANLDDWNTLGNLGTALLLQGRYEDAIDVLKKVVANKPDDAQMQLNLGISLSHCKSYAEAENAIRRAIELAPNSAGAYSALGSVLKALERFQDAEDAYRRAIELDPSDPDSYCNLGHLLAERGRSADAETLYRQAIERAPDNVRAYVLLGVLLGEQERYSDAVAVLEKALQHDATLAEVRALIGHNLEKLGRSFEKSARYGEAVDAFRRSIEFEPKQFLAYDELARLLVHLGQLKEAAEVHKQLQEHAPDEDRADVPTNLPEILEEVRQGYDAFLREMKWAPGDSVAYRILRQAHRSRDQIDSIPDSEAVSENSTGLLIDIRLRSPSALEFLKKHAQDVPRDFYSRLAIAAIYKKLDDIEKSEVYADEARSLIPADDWYNLARLESICDNADTAFEHLFRASEQPTFDPKIARDEPDFLWIRDDPRFDEIVVVPPED